MSRLSGGTGSEPELGHVRGCTLWFSAFSEPCGRPRGPSQTSSPRRSPHALGVASCSPLPVPLLGRVSLLPLGLPWSVGGCCWVTWSLLHLLGPPSCLLQRPPALSRPQAPFPHVPANACYFGFSRSAGARGRAVHLLCVCTVADVLKPLSVRCWLFVFLGEMFFPFFRFLF